MAHPFASVKQSKVERSRVADITKGYSHPDEPEDKSLVRKMVKSSALKASGGRIEGKASGGRLDRYARGGKVKKGATNVNVIVAPQGGAGAAMPPPPMMPPAGPPPAMMGPPPGAGGAPGLPPPGPAGPPGMIRRSGGRAYAAGGSVKAEGIRNGTAIQHTDGKNDQDGLGRGRPITYAKGGGVEARNLTGRKINMATMGWKPQSGSKLGMPKGSKFATGGPVEAGKSMGPKMPGGDNGEGRLAKAAMQKRAH